MILKNATHDGSRSRRGNPHSIAGFVLSLVVSAPWVYLLVDTLMAPAITNPTGFNRRTIAVSESFLDEEFVQYLILIMWGVSIYFCWRGLVRAREQKWAGREAKKRYRVLAICGIALPLIAVIAGAIVYLARVDLL